MCQLKIGRSWYACPIEALSLRIYTVGITVRLVKREGTRKGGVGAFELLITRAQLTASICSPVGTVLAGKVVLMLGVKAR